MAHLVDLSFAPDMRVNVKAPNDQRRALLEISMKLGSKYGKTSLGPMDGHRMPTDFPIKMGTTNSKIAKFQKILSGPSSWSISNDVKGIIDRLDPGAHQYFPIEIYTKGNDEPTKDYYILNVCTRLDSAIDPSKSTCKKTGSDLKNFPDRWVYMFPEHVDRKITLSKNTVSGNSLWADARYRGVFMSDELFSELKSMNIECLESILYMNEV